MTGVQTCALPILAVDAILDILINISSNFVVYDKVIYQHVMNELPFMATENILMEAVRNGGDRQELHEKIRIHSMEAANQVKMMGKPNDLLERIAEDAAFKLTFNEIAELMEPTLFIGRSSEQVCEFIEEFIEPILNKHRDELGIEVDLKV